MMNMTVAHAQRASDDEPMLSSTSKKDLQLATNREGANSVEETLLKQICALRCLSHVPFL